MKLQLSQLTKKTLLLGQMGLEQFEKVNFGIVGSILLIAFIYSSVGFGGASGYLIVMAVLNVPSNIAVSVALVLNLIVAGIAFVTYFRKGYFKLKLLLPFLITSIPFAFLGGTFKLEQFTYLAILHSLLFIIAIRMLIVFRGDNEGTEYSSPSFFVMGMVGSVLGFLAGLIGIGGGVFLSPLIILAKWGSPKHAASTAAGFIFMNSLSGLLGRIVAGTFEFGSFGMSLIPAGIIGSLLGSTLGAKYLSGNSLKKFLGMIMLAVVIRFVWESLF